MDSTDPSRSAEPEAWEPVTLHVYDLNEQLQGANKVMKCVGTGVYHGAVEVYGYEWSFGYTEEDTGVFCCDPKENPCFVYRQSVPMGHTKLREVEVVQLIEELEVQWPGESYNLLQRNCCDFSNELCKQLGVGPCPGWVKSAAGVGALLDDVIHMRHLKDVIKRGHRSRRGEASPGSSLAASPGALERANTITSIGGGIADLGAGVKELIVDRASGVLQEGRKSRGAASDDSYRFGDFSRGLISSAASGVKGVLTQGRAARDAPEGDGYRFGDATRGLVSAFAKR
uniref:PPPDE domain-containing protein n=1 Tax=Alexandrium catenella TaxID=2925 RepID=A0A7S1SG92_ALECA